MRPSFADVFICANYVSTIWFLIWKYSADFGDQYFLPNIIFFSILNGSLLLYYHWHKRRKADKLLCKMKGLLRENYGISTLFRRLTSVATGGVLFAAVLVSLLPTTVGFCHLLYSVGLDELSERINFAACSFGDESIITIRCNVDSFCESEKQELERNNIIARVYGKNSKKMARRFVQLGQVYAERGDYRVAEKHFKDAIKRYRYSDSLGLLEAYTGLASITYGIDYPAFYNYIQNAIGEIGGSFYENDHKRMSKAFEMLKTLVYPGTMESMELGRIARRHHNDPVGPLFMWGIFGSLLSISIPILFANAMFEKIMLNGLVGKMRKRLYSLENWQDQADLLQKLISIQIYRKNFVEADKLSRRLNYILE